jgi:hypothetical protein
MTQAWTPERIRALMHHAGFTGWGRIARLAAELNMSEKTVGNWIWRGAKPGPQGRFELDRYAIKVGFDDSSCSRWCPSRVQLEAVRGQLQRLLKMVEM